jgi:preprotein translocase SecE subunit
MDKIRALFQGIGTFVEEVVHETRKTTWPEKRELVESTVLVIVSLLLLSAVVWLSDKILILLLKALIWRG